MHEDIIPSTLNWIIMMNIGKYMYIYIYNIYDANVNQILPFIMHEIFYCLYFEFKNSSLLFLCWIIAKYLISSWQTMA